MTPRLLTGSGSVIPSSPITWPSRYLIIGDREYL
jgi:hypothetical protein